MVTEGHSQWVVGLGFSPQPEFGAKLLIVGLHGPNWAPEGTDAGPCGTSGSSGCGMMLLLWLNFSPAYGQEPTLLEHDGYIFYVVTSLSTHIGHFSKERIFRISGTLGDSKAWF